LDFHKAPSRFVAAFVFDEAFTVPTLTGVIAFAMGFTRLGILVGRLLPLSPENLRRGVCKKGSVCFGRWR